MHIEMLSFNYEDGKTSNNVKLSPEENNLVQFHPSATYVIFIFMNLSHFTVPSKLIT